MKKIIILLLLLSVLFIACDSQQSADSVMAEQTQQAMKEANAQIGMPAITNFQERKLAKMIFELRDKEDLITYAYLVSKNTGQLIFIGKCIGFGLPYSVQYTNPEKYISELRNSMRHTYKLAQADPNGLFMPQGLSATWLMMIDPETNEARPVYVEPEIIVSPFRLK